MPGPPPQPTVIRLLRGNPGKRRIGREPQPPQPPGPPDPPEWLTGYARDEWRRVAAELHRMRLLTAIDIQVLAAYCTAYETWRTAIEVGKHIEGEREQRILEKVEREAGRAMLAAARQYGMTPLSRSHLIV